MINTENSPVVGIFQRMQRPALKALKLLNYFNLIFLSKTDTLPNNSNLIAKRPSLDLFCVYTLLFLFFSLPLMASTEIHVGDKNPGPIEIENRGSNAKVKTEIEVGSKSSLKPIVEWKKSSESNNIDPQIRAKDYKKAFDLLRLENPTADTYLIVSGVSIHYVESFEPMPNGTLIHLKIRRSKKQLESKIIRVENITELGQR